MVGCLVESHQTPAPGDAYSNRHGYRSLHSLCSIVYDPIGEYARNTIQVRAPAPHEREPKVVPFRKPDVEDEEAVDEAA